MSSRSTARAKAKKNFNNFIFKHTKKGKVRPTKINRDCRLR
jgi:hypothetical protein